MKNWIYHYFLPNYDGWYIYNLEGQTYSSNALEKLSSTVELRKKI